MKKFSSKPTVYLLDGSNFAMRLREYGPGSSPDERERELLAWLADAARTEALRASCFRVVFDGPWRKPGASGPSITVYFGEGEAADDLLAERAYFMRTEGVRAVVVTSDNGLRDRVAAEGALTMTCETFRRLAEAELRKESR